MATTSLRALDCRGFGRRLRAAGTDAAPGRLRCATPASRFRRGTACQPGEASTGISFFPTIRCPDSAALRPWHWCERRAWICRSCSCPGTIGEEIAVNAMRVGAQDYIMKSNLTKVAPGHPARAAGSADPPGTQEHRAADAPTREIRGHRQAGGRNRARFQQCDRRHHGLGRTGRRRGARGTAARRSSSIKFAITPSAPPDLRGNCWPTRGGRYWSRATSI